MNAKHEFNIRWTEITVDSFMYGSHVSFTPFETIFKNELMPSGIIIHQWKMCSHFYDNQVTPTLPILKKHHPYRFYFDYEAVPAGSVYFKVVFKRRDGTILETQMIQGQEGEVVLSEGTASYDIQMINAASQILKFRRICIQEVGSVATSNTLTLSEIQNRDDTLPLRNLLFVESPGVCQDAIHPIKNCVMISEWETLTTDEIVVSLDEAIRSWDTLDALQWIGYHDQSNEIAYTMMKRLGGHAWVTLLHQEDKDDDMLHSHRVTVYRPKADVLTSALQVVQPLLNPSGHLYALATERLNGGER
ncbi:accessory Sec system protein Asp3 [Staphylococcus lutrae]|uniref:Accessory Sec system protein Asp3 n=1 Tax=Staphylococcus lutrae TaxID=155085 RepID=A0AAC9RTB1_9STAP|nr:accessory Sec system protein Asp3 [Staphylococcus lutrae]ARJ50754.1 accessory Sec system protein Asp3 [Staphylococcus lutrae]PNZ37855.1 accessory Sec system protein Asp3 [Staphylococcus lutrae]